MSTPSRMMYTLPRIVSLCILFMVNGMHARPFLTSAHQVDDAAFPHWIAPAEGDEPGLYLFRKAFELNNLPDSFVIHISADPRYRLWVNGEWITFGPAAGHFYHWNYETLDIQPFLKMGTNTIAVEVRQAAALNGPREISFWTGMILSGPNVQGVRLQSDASWKVLQSPGWKPLEMTASNSVRGYIAGGTESWDAGQHPVDWMQPDFDDSDWPNAIVKNKGSHLGLNTWKVFNYRLLQERPIPLIETRILSLEDFRRRSQDGQPSPTPKDWPVKIPAHSRVTLLLDNGVVDNGFPMLEVSGGAGGKVAVQYQEALVDAVGRKGNRNQIEGKSMRGIFDQFYPDGSDNHLFEPFWIRSFRYVELDIETRDEPLFLEGFEYRQVRYPFDKKGTFTSKSDSRIEPILDASWRTLELCALETYMDCPYYEQLQYIGDTRIQSLVSLYLTGDDRLMRNAIDQFHDSLQPIGLIRSAFPISGIAAQIIPPFSLVFVSMVHDHFLYWNDADLIREKLPAIRYILSWFTERVQEDGLLGPLPYWNHTDGGASGFFNGSPPGSEEGGSVQLSLMLAIALDQTAQMLETQGELHAAENYVAISKRLKEAVISLAWSDIKKQFAETAEQQVFSQHTNALALLAGVVPEGDQGDFAERIASDATLIQATLYFQFYVFEAYQKAGRADLIVAQLDRWQRFLDMGLTTFPEHHLESRSDVHAWAAHPLYHLPASVAGVRPATPGYQTVHLKPCPGTLEDLSTTVLLPQGKLTLQMYFIPEQNHWKFSLQMPEDVEALLEWNGKTLAIDETQTTLLLEGLQK